VQAKARTAAWCAWPLSRCGWEELWAQKAGRSDAAAHATHVWRRNVGHGKRQWPQDCWPRRAVTGAMPASCWSAAAEASRSRGAPQATRRRGAKTAPAPGTASNQGTAGWAWARGAMARAKSAMACTVTRRGAMRACPRSTVGVMTPSAVGRARA
jgi:hypothetical protein